MTGHLVKSAARADYDHAYLAASHAALGNDAEANSNARRFEEINPETTAEIFITRQPFHDPEIGERLKLQLMAAGLA